MHRTNSVLSTQRRMSFSPYFRSPFTDLTQCPISQQWHGPCRDIELKVMDCLEAYGLDRGRIQCNTLIQDFQECSGRHKQRARADAMRAERFRQYRAGERSKEDLYIGPIRPDAF
ncbi:hypothetical protein FQA39_LY08079 [Lamprigera yunnana]|nr:hypothetical protein FQA39_LY08079 [Lamprigera yunnana]